MADKVQTVLNLEEKDENVDGKKAAVTHKLSKRDDERIAELSKRKEVKDSAAAENESTDFFISKFTTAKNSIDSLLDSSDSLEKSKLLGHFDKITSEIQQLQKFVTDTASFLPVYEVQKAQDVVSKLLAGCAEKRDELMPKKKFSFSSKKKGTGKAVKEAPKIEKKAIKEFAITECNFSDLVDEKLSKGADEINAKDVALARLTNCTVTFPGSPGSLVMDHLVGCRVFCGPISGSIFIDACKDCVFVVSCQQLRIHSTYDSQFYIHVTSKAIVEDCERVAFAPFNWSYEGMEEHYKLTRLDKNINNWDDVDDFNWLANDKKSPHWSVLEEDKRVAKWEL